MPSIDERIVAMSFENAEFERRVAVTMTTLSKLDTAVKNVGGASGLSNIEKDANKVTLQGPMSALDKLKAKLSGAGSGAAQGLGDIDRAGNKVTLEGPSRAIDKLRGKFSQLSAGTTFTDIEKASDKVELSGMSRALDNVTSKFSVLQGAASVALGGIASQAAMKGASFAKSFAFGPLQQGLGEYQTNLNSIQTILANTQGQQESGLDAVNQHLGELNTYSDRTIYNFSEMAKNIGTFTAAGVDLDKSTQSIKGIANLAALSGSNSQQASTAMYQLSQAIASGRVGLQDWNSVVNAGMGGAVFQKALMRTAENMGSIEKGALKVDKATGKATINGQSFRESIMAKPGEQSWLTSDVLVKTLGQFTGDMTDAQLAAQGFTKEQIKAIQAQAKTAQDAATQVKTLPQVFDVARETIGSGWAKTFSLIFGDFEESKKTFTEFSNFINGIINQVSNARNKVLGEWKKLGGRTELISGIKQAFADLMLVLKPIYAAFRDIFPAKTGEDLFKLTKGFHDLMVDLRPSPELVDKIGRIFKGLFAVLHIGWTIIKDLGGVFADLLGIVGKGSGGFLGFVAGIGDFLVVVDEALTKGGLLEGFFRGLGSILALPLRLLKSVASAIGSLFGGGDNRTIVERNNELIRFGKVLTPAERLVQKLKDGWERLVGAFEKTKGALEPWFSSFVDGLKNFGKIVGDALSNLNFEDVLSGVQTGLLAGLLVMVKKMFGKGGGFLDTLSKTLGSVNTLVGGFTKQMEAMQSKLKAEALLAIAGAVAVLAGGIYILSTIDGDKLQKAMLAVAVGLGELMGAMKLMTSGMGLVGVLQLPIIAAGLIGLATAVLILSGAMKIFATMSWEDIGKGLVGVAGSLAAVGLAMNLMPPTLPLTAAGLILIGIALNLIAAAIGQFGAMKWEEVGKGLFAVADALGLIALTTSQMPPNLPITAAGLILMGIALGFIGSAIKKMGELDFATILKGLGSMGAALAIIAGAMLIMPPVSMIAIGAGLILVGIGLSAVGKALEIMGGIGIGGIVKGLVALAGVLVILAVGLTAMEGTLPGALALMAAAAALAILAPTLAFLGTLKWTTIIKGLLAIALALGTLSIVGLVASEGLVALGIALLPLAAVLVLVAGAVYLLAKGLSLLAGEGGKGIAVIVTAITAFVALIPKLVIDFIKGILGIFDQLRVLLPKIVVALGVIIDTIIAFVIANAPKLAIAIGVLVDSILQVLLENTPKIIAAGVKLLRDLLNGISQNIVQVTNKVTEIIVKFLGAMEKNAPKLVNAGAKTLIAFIQGITNNIPKVVAAVVNMVGRFVLALASNVGKVITAGQNLILKLIGSIVAFVPRLIRAGTDIIISFLGGIQEAIPRIKDKALKVARTFLNNLADGLVGLADAGFNALIKFLNGLERSIRTHSKRLRDAGWGVVDAIVDGMMDGFNELWHKVEDKAETLADHIPKVVKKALGMASPSKVFMDIGKNTVAGFSKGIEDNQPMMQDAAKNTFGALPSVVSGFLGIHSPSVVMEAIGQDTIKGFINGIRGSQADVKNAFRELNNNLTNAMKEARKAIRENQKILDDERSKSEPDYEAIAAAEKAIAKNEEILRRTTHAHNTLVDGLVVVKKQLLGLKKDYDNVSQALDKAKQALQDAKQARDDAKKSLTEKFSATPTVDQESTDMVGDYVTALEDQVAATKSYTDTLAKLRALGLDDTTYQKLLDEGLAGKAFAEQLLAGGQSAVTSINTLDKQLLSAATTLAKNASTTLYQAGVDAAQGLVNGLKAKKADIDRVMTAIGKRIVAVIKNQLKIRSPSQIMAEVGKLTAEGVIVGLKGSSQAVQDAAAGIGDDAASAMADSLSHISDVLSSEVDPDLTITPVLDLTQFQKDAAKMGDMANVIPITAATSFGQATSISAEKTAADSAAVAAAGPGGTSFQYTQNNYSPESLSDVEIYRQTRNQLSQVKNALGLVS